MIEPRVASQDLTQEDLDVYASEHAALSEKAGFPVPSNTVARIAGGESLLSIWRDLRNMTLLELSEKSGVNEVYLARIERGEIDPTLSVMRDIATALRVDLDSIGGR